MRDANSALRKKRYLTVATVLVAATFSAVSANPAASQEKIKIGSPPFYSCMAGILAAELGFFKEAGLDVEIVPFAGGSLVNEALLSGGIDFGMGVGAGPAVALTARGARVVVVAGEAYSDTTAPPDHLIIAANSPIKDVKELDGKPVAIHAKGTIGHVLLETLSKRFGIKPVIVEIPASSHWIALRRGDVAAVMAETPFPEQMKVEGGRYLYSLPNKDVVPYLATTVTLTTQKVIDERPEVVKKAVTVLLRTARWIMDDPERAKQAIAAKLNYKAEVTREIDARVYKWSRNGQFLMPGFQWWGQNMKTLGMIQNEPPYEKFFVSRFTDMALKELGTARDPDFETAHALPMPK